MLGEEELLEHEPHPGRPQRRQLAVRQCAARSSPVIFTVPALGRSRLPITCSSVVLPEPEGPTTATNSPAVTVRLTSAAPSPAAHADRSC